MDDLVVDDPHALFRDWLREAEAAEPGDANAMTVTSVGPDGMPSARILLLKGLDERGFVFYSNLESRKGRELLGHSKSALCFHWKTLGRQVRVEGNVERVSDAEADIYFATRPRGSQIGAWASRQSEPLADRETLIAAVAEVEARFEGKDVPRPPYWSGLRVLPERIEFWRAGEFRLHDRMVYEREGDGWRTTRLYP